MSAKQTFTKIADELKERYVDLLIVAEGQAGMIAEAKKILEEFKINENDPDWGVTKRLKCSLCDIFDCSTRNSMDPEECLLSLDGQEATKEEKYNQLSEVYCGTEYFKKTAKFRKQQYISLEEVQKMEQEWELAFDKAAQTANTEAMKIIEANKIIEAAVKEARLVTQPQDMKTRLTFDFNEFQSLQAALSLNAKKAIESNEVIKQ